MLTFWRTMGLFVLITLASVAVASAAKPGPNSSFRKAKADYRSLLKSDKKQYRHHWDRVVGQILKVAEKYPKHSKAASALYVAGEAYRELFEVSRLKDDLREAVKIYDRLAKQYPKSSLADDALVLGAEILEGKLGQPTEAYLRYKKVVDRHPKGDMLTKAKGRMEALKKYAPAPPPKPVKRTPATKVKVTGLRHWASASYARIVLDLSGPAKYTFKTLGGDSKGAVKKKLFIDVQGGVLGKAIKSSTAVQGSLLKAIRTGRPSANKVRVVLDLDRLENYRVFDLENSDRIVLEVFDNDLPKEAWSAPETSITKPTASKTVDEIGKIVGKKARKKAEPVSPIVATATTSTKLRTIVVDAGHGGRDPGAVGRGGLKEKDVTLAIAKKLAKKLRSKLGCKVVLTRDRDKFLALRERTAKANRINADLFISIHANASKNRQAQGVETYYLNFSKSDKAIAVAARENDTSLKEVGDLEMILFDLMANSKINESSRLAASVQENLVKGLKHRYKVKDHGVRQGPFHVLLGANMPSILVEAAFISNRQEERRLKSSAYQEQVAEAVARGVQAFAKEAQMVARK